MNKKWFSLIEVIVATSIITISVFWVYKLIWENTKIITNSSNTTQANYIFPVIQECIENIWFDNFSKTIWLEYFFNIWNNMLNCNTWTTSNVIIDNLEYKLKWRINNFWTWFINWEISVENNEIKTLTWEYIQLKK